MPNVIPPQYKLLIQLGLLLAIFFAGFGVRGYMAGKDDLRRDNAEQAAKIEIYQKYTKKFEAYTATFNKLQLTLHSIDAKHAGKLHEALDENSALRTDLGVARRMRLQGTTCPKRPAEAGDPATGSVGDATEVELSEETRQAVFDLRADLIEDGKKLDYLHDYLREIGLSPPVQ